VPIAIDNIGSVFMRTVVNLSEFESHLSNDLLRMSFDKGDGFYRFFFFTTSRLFLKRSE
jgi:hypothetical protein